MPRFCVETVLIEFESLFAVAAEVEIGVNLHKTPLIDCVLKNLIRLKSGVPVKFLPLLIGRMGNFEIDKAGNLI